MFTIRQASLKDAPAISALLQDLTRRFIAPDCSAAGDERKCDCRLSAANKF